MDDDFSDLQRLLRLKRHEAPPPEFFEDLLVEFHRRQRAELLRRPLWRLALDRLEGAMPVFPAARYAYAGSFAVAVVAVGLGVARMMPVPGVAIAANGKTVGKSVGAAQIEAGPGSVLAVNAKPTVLKVPDVIKWHDPAPSEIDDLANQIAVTAPARLNLRARQHIEIPPALDFNNPLESAAMSARPERPVQYLLEPQPSYALPVNYEAQKQISF